MKLPKWMKWIKFGSSIRLYRTHEEQQQDLRDIVDKEEKWKTVWGAYFCEKCGKETYELPYCEQCKNEMK
jgi:hypothetical protein